MSALSGAGIPLALLATTAFNTGLILEKRALGRMPALDIRRVARMVVSLLATPAWLAGFALILTGLACQVIVLAFEPVSVVQPVVASGVALVLVLSRLVLRERLGRAEFWCVAAMAVSVVLLALSVDGSRAAAGHHASAGWMTAVVVPSVLAGLLIAASPLRAVPRKHRAPASGLSYGLGTGLMYGVASLATKGLSGVLTGSHTMASIAIGIVSSPYLYLLAGCSGAAMLLYQAALQSCRASILIPTSSVVSSVYFVIAGTWLFHEHLPTSPVKLGLRLAGIAMAGLVLIALSRHTAAQAPAGGDGRGSEGSAAGHPRVPIDGRGLLYFPSEAVLSATPPGLTPAAGRRSARAGRL
jgi:uncharacterized membrane protein